MRTIIHKTKLYTYRELTKKAKINALKDYIDDKLDYALSKYQKSFYSTYDQFMLAYHRGELNSDLIDIVPEIHAFLKSANKTFTVSGDYYKANKDSIIAELDKLEFMIDGTKF